MYPGTYAATAPDRPAVIMAGSARGRDLRASSTSARSGSRSSCATRGLQRGDHVALFMENHPRFLEVVWAALRSGLYITAVNCYLTADEVAYIVDDCEAKALRHLGGEGRGRAAAHRRARHPECRTSG